MRAMRQIRPIPKKKKKKKKKVEVALWMYVFRGFVPGFLVLVVAGPRDPRTEISSYNGMQIREEKSRSEAN
jgi:hypothetical protein